MTPLPIWLSLAAALAAPAPTGGTYHLVQADSVLLAVSHTRGVVEALSARHVIRATTLEGALTWSPGATPPCALTVTVPAEGLRVDHPDDRRLAGLDGALEEDDRAEVRAVVLGEGLLAAGAHPFLSFRSTGCAVRGDIATLQGELSFSGATDEVLVPLLIDAQGDRLRASGALPILQSRFGIEPFSALLGAIEVDDAVRLRFDLQGERAPAATQP